MILKLVFKITIYLAITCFIEIASANAALEPPQQPVDYYPVSTKTNPYMKLAEKLAAIPEKKLDLASAKLQLEKAMWPKIDVQKYLSRIDQIAEEVKNYSGGTKDPEQRIRHMNTYFYKYLGFDYNKNPDLVLSSDLKVSALSTLLDSKQGTCFSLPLLYMVIAQRLGWPIKMVAAPRHLFIRYVDPRLKQQNIEATGYGGYTSDEEYIRDLKITPLALEKGTYMRTLTNREVLGAMIGDYASHWIHKIVKSKNNVLWMQELARSIQLQHLSIKLYPIGELEYINMGNRYNDLAIFGRKIFDLEWAGFPKERINANVLELMNQDMAAIRFHSAQAQRWYGIARSLGVREADFTPEAKQEMREDMVKHQINAESLHQQFEIERQQMIERLKKNRKSGELKRL